MFCFLWAQFFISPPTCSSNFITLFWMVAFCLYCLSRYYPSLPSFAYIFYSLLPSGLRFIFCLFIQFCPCVFFLSLYLDCICSFFLFAYLASFLIQLSYFCLCSLGDTNFVINSCCPCLN